MRHDRWERLARVVEDIATHPGQTRAELAARYFLSQRQMQADLDLIKSKLRLPLVRTDGYRFDETRGERSYALRDEANGGLVVALTTRFEIPREVIAA